MQSVHDTDRITLFTILPARGIINVHWNNGHELTIAAISFLLAMSL